MEQENLNLTHISHNRLNRNEYLVLCGLLLLGIVNAFWMLPTITLEDHECYVAVTAREMVQNGNWILPTMNGQPRINKTPMSYWIVAGIGKITGHIDEFTTRLPSAVFAVLSAVIIFYFVYRWLGFRIAAVSSAVWVTSLAYVRCSHNGRPDMAVAFFITLCLLSFYSVINSKSRREQIFYALIFWVSFGLGNLAKGPEPVPLVMLPVIVYITVNRKLSIIPKMLPIAGFLIFLAIMLPWPLVVAYKFNWNLEIWKKEFVDRFFGEYAPGNYPIYFYFLMMFKYIAPYFIFLPIALIAPFFKVWSEKRDVMIYLWLWFVANIVFLTINLGKRQHYILPLMPSMAILVGILLDDMVFCRKAFNLDFVRRLGKGHLFTVIVSIAGGVVFTAIFTPRFLTGVIILCLFVSVITGVIVLLFYKGMLRTALTFSFVSASLLFMVYVWFNAKYVDDIRPIREFEEEITFKIPKGENLVAYKKVSSVFVHYYGKVVFEIDDIQALYQHYQQGDWILAISGYSAELEKDGRFEQLYYKPYQRGHPSNSAGGLFHKQD
jgi:4-amino-4-deoxy-L-arabinose transferase-like glycosyltransferase